MALRHLIAHPGRRFVLPTLAFVTVCAGSPWGVANAAPVFDVDGYSACTETTAPAPDQDFDGMVTTCCVQHAGVPAPTRYGMGCVAPMDAGALDDERPVIVLPMRAAPPEQSQDALDALNDLAELPPPDPGP